MGLFSSKSHPNHGLSIIAKNCKVVGDIDLEGDIQIDGFGEEILLKPMLLLFLLLAIFAVPFTLNISLSMG
ncbi:hypothetical protein [Salinivibrio costicola]|uniref:hypothetical protein n=1 Tax=Salinivibrio costicola TaxID=51367 RepID=UPI003F6FAE38